jgi:hypothetical protein
MKNQQCHLAQKGICNGKYIAETKGEKEQVCLCKVKEDKGGK